MKLLIEIKIKSINISMLNFIQYCELVLNGKQVNTPKTKTIRRSLGARFPDDGTMLSILGIPLFEPDDDELQRLLDKAEKSPEATRHASAAVCLEPGSLRAPQPR
jgi:hypothetical protein